MSRAAGAMDASLGLRLQPDPERWTLPRFRYDQLMDFGWKFLLPAALFNIVLSATIALFAPLD